MFPQRLDSSGAPSADPTWSCIKFLQPNMRYALSFRLKLFPYQVILPLVFVHLNASTNATGTIESVSRYGPRLR